MVAEESTAWPGVSRPVDLRRARLRAQVEHGLDARHARVLRARPRPPPLPPRPAHLQPDLRLLGELRAAALPRRGRARQGLAARRRCPATTGSSAPICARCYAYMWAHPGKKLLFMGGEFGQEHEWSSEGSLDWHLLERPEHAGDPGARPRPQPALPRRAGAVGGRLRAGRLPLVGGERRRRERGRVRAASRPKASEPWFCVCNFSAVSRPRYRVGLPRAGRWRELLNTDDERYGGGGVGNAGGLPAEQKPWHDQPFSSELTLPPLGVSGWFRSLTKKGGSGR